MKMASFGTAVSGLRAAQTGLYVTGHNMSNVNTQGYTRQRAWQVDEKSTTVGMDGNRRLQVGLGTSVKDITQIRDEFLDARYRQQNSALSFYQTQYDALTKIENILGELYNDGRMSDSITQMWRALQEMVLNPEGGDTRGTFITAAEKFIERANDVYDSFYKEQVNMNNQVIEMVDRINEIGNEIEFLNEQIMKAESAGDHANDLRDTRNLLLDELSSYVETDIKEDSSGRVHVSIEGQEFISNGNVSKLGLRYTSPGYPFVEPVFTNRTDTLGHGETARVLFRNMDNQVYSADNENDTGALKGLLLMRGKAPGNYMSNPADVENYEIPKLMMQFDTLINSMVDMFNSLVSPIVAGMLDVANAPYDLDGNNNGIEIFSRKKIDRFDAGGVYNAENPANWDTMYTSGNLCVNPLIKNNTNLLAFSSNQGDLGDTALLNSFLDNWKDGSGSFAPSFTAGGVTYSFDDFYKEMIVGVGERGAKAGTALQSANTSIVKVFNDKSAMSDVSLDEEVSNMMKYQHAYNAAARIVNILDGMLDTVINRM